MARSIATIYDSLVTAKNSAPVDLGLTDTGSTTYASSLASLNGGSALKIWRMWLFIQAFGIYVLETYFDLFKTEVDATIKSGVAGTLLWTAAIAKKYQYGDSLSYTADFLPYYATIDTTKQIVKYAAVSDVNGVVVLRAAKMVSAAPAKLASGELSGLTTYMLAVKPAGIQMVVRTADADSVLVNVDLVYNPLYSSSIVSADAKLAAQAYIAGITFGESFRLNALEDVLQGVAGVTGVRLQVVQGTAGGITTTVYNLSQGINGLNYNSFAGYMVLNTTDSVFNCVAS